MLFFSRWPGTATAHTSKFVGIQLKKKIERRRYIPNMRFVRDGAYSSAYWLMSLFGDYEGRDFTM